MSLVTVKDFGEALNISGGTIRSRISRKKLCCNRKGLIDTENPLNYIYLLEINGGDQSVFEKYDAQSLNTSNIRKRNVPATKKETNIYIDKKKTDLAVEKVEIAKKTENNKVNDSKGSVRVAPTVKTKISKISPEEKRQKDLDKIHNQTLLEIDIAQKQANLQNIQRTAEIKQMQLEKIMGNTLPLDQVTSILAINYKAIFKSFHAQLKNIASTMVQNLGGTKDDLNSIMVELEQILNHIKDTSKENSNDDIERLIEEYSQVRSRGERKG